MEVLPTPHFSCGGIKIDVHGATTLEGLFAAGEAGGGIHGANRLGANSFPDLQVFGARAGESSGHYAQKNRTRPDVEKLKKSILELTKPLGQKEGSSPISIRKNIQKFLYQNVGIMREKEGLGKTIQTLEELRDKEVGRMRVSSPRVFNYEWVESIKIRNMLRAALVIAKCALFREESRGVHYREDFPEMDQNWWVNVHAKRENSDVKIFKIPVVVNKKNPVMP
jgi:succinate dehydrogenase/fumarate reductase flavoprotein subunit